MAISELDINVIYYEFVKHLQLLHQTVNMYKKLNYVI